ncbi:hypothetical protein HHX47_DHR7000278 [Lentinula edodes]|nr:hypothetical protein HHX47_DHR7000278 [Lentinula edodes]
MFEPIRGGTRGGQGDFKWTDVSADKDRENYLGHSINAPTGRWQKNKDVHWYSRDLKDSEAERLEEIRKIKEAEAEALAVALYVGFLFEDSHQNPAPLLNPTPEPEPCPPFPPPFPHLFLQEMEINPPHAPKTPRTPNASSKKKKQERKKKKKNDEERKKNALGRRRGGFGRRVGRRVGVRARRKVGDGIGEVEVIGEREVTEVKEEKEVTEIVVTRTTTTSTTTNTAADDISYPQTVVQVQVQLDLKPRGEYNGIEQEQETVIAVVGHRLLDLVRGYLLGIHLLKRVRDILL